MNPTNPTDTIAAIATPIGRGGIGIVRISGEKVPYIAQMLLGKIPKPRFATFSSFLDSEQRILDKGIAVYFPVPHSFTGEAVLELQGHGGIVVLDQILHTILKLGARLARPGEFSERAFLNGKIDLTQAEAIADLIDSASVQAARCAMRSLQGEFSQQIYLLVEELTWLRTYIEAGIDFVDEEIDLLADGQVSTKLADLTNQIEIILAKAQQGFLLKEGLRIALIGQPNVGKSSLLNCLAGRETAIVTPIAGTTRDIVRDQIQLDGISLHIIDTAGLHETTDIVEQEGIRRTKQAATEADAVLVLLDERHVSDDIPESLLDCVTQPLILIRNKIDLSGQSPGLQPNGVIYLSAKHQLGIDTLKKHLKEVLGIKTQNEGLFIARRRHLNALERARIALKNGALQLEHRASELLAEELRQAQYALSEITGEVTADDLLERIFSTFCIGK